MDRGSFVHYGYCRSRIRMTLECLLVLLISVSFLPLNDGTLTFQSHHLSKRSHFTFSQSSNPPVSENAQELGIQRTAVEENPFRKMRTKRAAADTNSSEPKNPIDRPQVVRIFPFMFSVHPSSGHFLAFSTILPLRYGFTNCNCKPRKQSLTLCIY